MSQLTIKRFRRLTGHSEAIPVPKSASGPRTPSWGPERDGPFIRFGDITVKHSGCGAGSASIRLSAPSSKILVSVLEGFSLYGGQVPPHIYSIPLGNLNACLNSPTLAGGRPERDAKSSAF